MARFRQVLVWAGFCGSFLAAQNSQAQVVKYSNEFLQIGVGSRALGMGGANAALTNDPTAGYWNPAGLIKAEQPKQVSLMHNAYFLGSSNYDYGSALYKIDDQNAVGLSVVRFAVDNIPNTLNLIDGSGTINYDRVSSFSVANYAFLFSYARAFSDDLRGGANFKIVHSTIGPFAQSWGFGLDAGVQKDLNENWHIAAMARDVTSTFNAWSFNTATFRDAFIRTNNTIPKNSVEVTLPRLILAGAYTRDLGEKAGVAAEADLEVTTDGKRNTLIKTSVVSIDPRIGVEGNYNKLIYLRLGIKGGQQFKTIDGATKTQLSPSAGLGLSYKGLRLDYALTDIGDVSQGQFSNVFSLQFGFGDTE